MNSANKWGFRVKLAIVTLICTFFLLLLLIPPSGEEFAGVTGILFGVVAIVFMITLPLIPILIVFDARAIKKNKDYNWTPRPWFWGVGVLLYGIMLIPYLLLRKKRIGNIGGPLKRGLFVRLPKNSWLQSQVGFVSNKYDNDLSVNRHILKLKIMSLIFIVSFVSTGGIGQRENLSFLLPILTFISYLTLVYLVWKDGKAVKQYGEWKPKYLLWVVATLMFYGFPAVVYLLRRYQKQGDLGPSLWGIFPFNSLFSRDGSEQQSVRSESLNNRQKSGSSNVPVRDELEQAKLAFQQGKQLAEKGEYIDARDSFESAQTIYKELKEDDELTESATSFQVNLERAERGIEGCWIEPLIERLDVAETHLEEGEYEKARDSFEQVNAVLLNRSFKYHDLDSLEWRVQIGLNEVRE